MSDCDRLIDLSSLESSKLEGENGALKVHKYFM
jgi:hypothetical protein